jgi:hypothetical protein
MSVPEPPDYIANDELAVVACRNALPLVSGEGRMDDIFIATLGVLASIAARHCRAQIGPAAPGEEAAESAAFRLECRHLMANFGLIADERVRFATTRRDSLDADIARLCGDHDQMSAPINVAGQVEIVRNGYLLAASLRFLLGSAAASFGTNT